MTTIIRVKRHRQDDPVDAVVLACKRRKTGAEAQDLDSFKTILNFSGTVEKKDDKVAASTVVSFQSKSPNVNFKSHKPDITSKHRTENKIRTEENRFKVVSCLRSLNVGEILDSKECEDSSKNLTIVDVNVEKKDEGDEAASSNENAYVYDLYSTNFECEEDYNDLYYDNLLSVQPLACDLVYRDVEDGYNEDYEDPDEDSNDENNWRNDYPDSDNSIDEDDMRLAARLKGFGIDDGYDLSTDDEEEKYPNYDDDDYCHFKKAEDMAGSRYAKYKCKVMKDLELSDDDDDDDK